MVGTTQATNAIIERRALQKVGVIRLGGPLTTALPPLVDVACGPPRRGVRGRDDRRRRVRDYDGEELAPLDVEAIARYAGGIGERPPSVAITGVFSSDLTRARTAGGRDHAHRELGDIEICLSHEIGTIGLVERENATVLNAALMGVADSVAGALESPGRPAHAADTFFAQNDGTLMALEVALRFPYSPSPAGRPTACGARRS